MTDKLQIIKDQIKSLLKFADVSATYNVETKDGMKMVVNASDAEIGADIYNIDANGVQTPVEDGTYELTDGRKITVSGSKISEVAAPSDAASGDQTPTEPAPTSTQSMSDMPGEPVEPGEEDTTSGDLESRVASLEEQLSQITDMLSQLTSNSQNMMERVEKLSAEPASTGISSKKVEMGAVTDIVTKSEMDAIREIQMKIRKSKQ